MKILNTPTEESEILYSSIQIKIGEELSKGQFNKIKSLIMKNYQDEYFEELANMPYNMRHTTLDLLTIKKIRFLKV